MINCQGLTVKPILNFEKTIENVLPTSSIKLYSPQHLAGGSICVGECIPFVGLHTISTKHKLLQFGRTGTRQNPSIALRLRITIYSNCQKCPTARHGRNSRAQVYLTPPTNLPIPMIQGFSASNPIKFLRH